LIGLTQLKAFICIIAQERHFIARAMAFSHPRPIARRVKKEDKLPVTFDGGWLMSV
jgi:hypothetical protein